MSLHTALQAFKAHVENAFSFANPSAFLAEKEAEFKQAVADAHAAVEKRIDELETGFERRVRALEQTVAALGTPAQMPPEPPTTPTV